MGSKKHTYLVPSGVVPSVLHPIQTVLSSPFVRSFFRRPEPKEALPGSPSTARLDEGSAGGTQGRGAVTTRRVGQRAPR